MRDAIKCLLNKERGKNLEQDGDLERAAQNHSAVMSNQSCLEHECNGEPSVKARVQRTGYSNSPFVGEVIAGFNSAASPKLVVQAWMNSSEHRNIIQRSSFDHVGVGISINNGTAYYTADLAHR